MSVSTIKIEADLITLMEVLEKTGNATVAVQMLNCTYKEPAFNRADRVSHPDKDGKVEQFFFVSYDKWKDEVHYNYKNSWVREMSRESWSKLELWAFHVRKVMAEEILNEMDDVVDTEHGF
jgi:hypothetical protein